MNHNINKSTISPQQFLPSQQSSQYRIIPSYIKSQCQCQLCAYDYDLSERVPMMLCDNQHHCCLACVNQIIVRKKQCPFCRKQIQINKIFKNRIICKILQEMAKKQGKKIKINQNPQKMIKNNDVIIIPSNPNNNYNPINNQIQQATAIISDRQIQQSLLNNVNNYQPVPPQSCFNRLQCSEGVNCIVYLLTFIINTPFFITQLIYSTTIQMQPCMDTDYGAGISLRTWLLSSAIIGMSMFLLQFLVMLNKICCFNRKIFPQVITILNFVLFVLKFIGYNIYGIVVHSQIDPNDQATCDQGLQSYMTALLVIMIVFFSILCAIFDRR